MATPSDLIGLGLRAAQFVFAIISLGLNGYMSHWYDDHLSYSSSRINFLIFTSLWTLLALIYLVATPRFAPSLAHHFVLLAIDAVTMIFWFAGFIALAVWKSGLLVCYGNTCRCMTAAIVFGAFEWVLFAATTGLAAWRSRGEANSKGRGHADPEVVG